MKIKFISALREHIEKIMELKALTELIYIQISNNKTFFQCMLRAVCSVCLLFEEKNFGCIFFFTVKLAVVSR